MFLVYGLLDLLPPTFEPIFVPRLNDLFHFLQENKGLTEDEACIKHLGSLKRKKYFNKMKTQLRTQLGHYLLAQPSSPDNMQRTAYEDCYKDQAFYKSLLMSGQRDLAFEVAKNLVPRLEKLEIHTLLHQVAHDLLFHYSGIEGASRLVKKYERLVDRQEKIVQADSIIRKYRSKIAFICNTRESFTPSMIKEITAMAERAIPYLQLNSTYLDRFIYNIIIARYSVVYDNKNIIRYCEEALNRLPENYVNSRSFRFSFLQSKALPLAALGKLEEGKVAIREACQLAIIGSFNWHLAYIKRIMICLHAGDYQEAYILYKAHRQKKKPHKNAEIYWRLLYAYLYFLIKVGKIKSYGEEQFNLPKFLNDVPKLTRDKSGNNINILIVEILIRMYRGQFGRIIDRMDSLREYARVYTRKPETKRANIFLNMIVKMEAASFHRSRTEFKTQKLLDKLHSTPIKLGQNMAIELIPYPILWEEMLAMLRDQPRARTVRKRPVR